MSQSTPTPRPSPVGPSLSRSSVRPRGRRVHVWIAGLLAAGTVWACSDSGPTGPGVDGPASFEVTAPDTVFAGETFQVQIRALESDGSTVDASYSGSVTLSSSRGSLTPTGATVTAGTGSASVTLANGAGPITLTASADGATGSGETVLIGDTPVASVAITPASALFTATDESRSFTAQAFDADGYPTQAEFSWSSTEPGIVAVSEDGTVTAGAVGSAQVFAQAGGIESTPMVAVVARLVPGAVLIEDDQVQRREADGLSLAPGRIVPTARTEFDLEALDLEAEYGPGWQYRLTLVGVEAPSPGEILVGTGTAPVAGRVVDATPVADGVRVTLELVPYDEIFQELLYDEVVALESAEVVLSDEVAGAYDVRRGREGTIEMDPKPLALQTVEFPAGPFQCKAERALPLQMRVTPKVRLIPSLDHIASITPEGYEENATRGQLTVSLSFSPQVASRLEGTLDCKWKSPIPIVLPLPGPLGVLLGGHIGLGVGLEAKGTMTFNQFGVEHSSEASAAIEMGVRCLALQGGTETCQPYTTTSATGQVKNLWDPLDWDQVDPNLKVRVYGYGFATLGVGPAAIVGLLAGNVSFDLVEARAGLAMQSDLEAPASQRRDTGYRSNLSVDLLALARPGKHFDSVLKLWKRTAFRFEASVQTPLTQLPEGAFGLTPATVKAGTAEDPGDPVKFLVELDKSTFLGVEAIEAIQIVWTRKGDDGVYRPEEGIAFPCEEIPAAGQQISFECETTFREDAVGEHRFHAFMDLNDIVFLAPFPFEIAKDASADLVVEPPEPDLEVRPGVAFVPTGSFQRFQALLYGPDDKRVAWRAALGSIGTDGGYRAPVIPPGSVVIDTVRATSVAEPTLTDRALVLVSAPRIREREPECAPSESNPCDGEASSWGDPHLISPDGVHYDFHASGDFILAKSTEADDDFEVQVRFTQPETDELFSWNNAVAMRVAGHTVEVYASAASTPEVWIDGARAALGEGDVSDDLDGGSVALIGDSVAVSWPDRTMVVVKPSHVNDVLADVRLTLPYARRDRIEGLIGNFDGGPDDDVRIRDGRVLDLQLDPLYTDFRQSWWVPFGSDESLFSRGVETFDASFPPGAVTVDDLNFDDAVRSAEVCRDAGVLDPDVMEACVLDVALTGDDQWAFIAAGVDPNTKGILLSPAAAWLPPGASREFGAVVTGTEDRRVTWSTTGGTVTPLADNIMRYDAPEELGEYTITGTLSDGGLVATATVVVAEGPAGFNKTWNGSVSSDWYTAENWTPVGVPDSTDNVYIPTWNETTTPNPVGLNRQRPKVNNLKVDPGSEAWSTSQIAVRGDAEVYDFPYVEMLGNGTGIRGTVGTVQILGAVSAEGSLTTNSILVVGGALTIGRHTVEAATNLSVIQNGRIVMRNPDGRLVTGDLSHSGTSVGGSLTAGTIEASGNVELGAGVLAAGEHRLVFNGTSEQLFRAGAFTLNDVVFANPAGVVLVLGNYRLDGLVEVQAGRVFTNAIGAGPGPSVQIRGGLIDPDGGWGLPIVVAGAGVLLPATFAHDIQFGTGEALDVTLLDDLEVAGDVTVQSSARLDLAGRHLQVRGDLTTRGTGSIPMDAPDDRLTVDGNAVFGFQSGGVDGTGAVFTHGVFTLGGNLSDLFGHFRASGTHVTRLVGSGAQLFSMSCWFSNCGRVAPDGFTLAALEITNPTGVTFQGGRRVVSGPASIAADAVASLNGWLDFVDDLDIRGRASVPEGVEVTVEPTLFLRGTAILDNQGTMTVAACVKESGATVTGTDPC